MKNIVSIAAGSLALFALTTLSGCGSNPSNVSYGHIVRHPSPDLKGLSERPTDDRSAREVAMNTNWRMFWDDLGRTLMLDTPSRLHPYPVLNTSGQYR